MGPATKTRYPLYIDFFILINGGQQKHVTHSTLIFFILINGGQQKHVTHSTLIFLF